MKYRELLARLVVRGESFLTRALQWGDARPRERRTMRFLRWARFETRLAPLGQVPYRMLESCMSLIDPDRWFRMNRCAVVARRASVPRSRIHASRRALREAGRAMFGVRAASPLTARARRQRVLRVNPFRA